MRQVSLATKIGTTAELRPGAPDVIVASEPTLGATLRTKGRFYFLCEVARQQGNAGGDVAKEVADLARSALLAVEAEFVVVGADRKSVV